MSSKPYKVFHHILKSFLTLVYPPLCFHCQSTISSSEILCTDCALQLELIPLQHRCPLCFYEYETEDKICHHCKELDLEWDFIAAAFCYKDCIRTLLSKMKYNNCAYLSETFASYMFVQFTELGWPKPDIIVPVPQSRFKTFERGYNQSELIASFLAKLIGAPVHKVLKKTYQTVPQALLSHEERKKLQGDVYIFDSSHSIEDATVLVIDDVYTTGTTLNQIAKALRHGYPQRIYALTAAIRA